MESKTMKENGNEKFKEGDYVGALRCYTAALDIGDIKDTDKATLYKNKSMCYLKMNSFKEAAAEATKSLDLSPNDPKALYRRCLAYEGLGQIEDAYRDAAMLTKIDPKNTSVKPVLDRLAPVIREKVKQQSSTVSKVSQMFNLAFDSDGDPEQKLKAVNNLIVLAKEEAGAQLIVAQNGIEKLIDVLNSKNLELVQAGVRVLTCLSQDSKPRCWKIQEQIGLPKLGLLMSMNHDGLATSVGYLLQNMLTEITDIKLQHELIREYRATRKKGDPARYPQYKMADDAAIFTKEWFLMLIKMLPSAKVSAYGRDRAIELIIKNVDRKEGVWWTWHYVFETDGVEALLTVAGAVKQHQSIPVTEQSKMHASVALNAIYEDLGSDKERDKFKEKCSNFFKDLFGDEIIESKLEAIKAVSMLLQGPYEVGSMILNFEGVTQVMLALANSDKPLHQQIAVETIVNSASKKDKCAGLLKDAVPVLKKLYQESDDHIKVRALVGLCKLGSFGGTDSSNKPMAEGSTLTLAKSCRKYLTNPAKDFDLKQWAVEGLAFLTLDAEVKEELIADKEALFSLIEVAKSPSKTCLYAAASVLVNLTNSYEKKEMVPEMVELAKFAKQHVPEEHPKDKPECVKERVKKLVDAGIVAALVSLSNNDSKNSREQISRVFLTIATEEEYRGKLVQGGAAKVLMSLALEKNTDEGNYQASQALAKIAITMDPKVAFPGQRMYEVVRPLIQLLHLDRTGLQNFEALMALTNLASISDSVRKRIVSEKGVPKIEHYMFEEHEMICRAATECMCNMVMNEEVAKTFEDENDKVKLFTLYCGEEDPLLVRAAAGGLAILAQSPVVGKKIVQVKAWYDIMLQMAVTENLEIQHRGLWIVKCLIESDKEIAEKVVEGKLLEVLMAYSITQDADKVKLKECAEQALTKAMEYGIIEAKPQELS